MRGGLVRPLEGLEYVVKATKALRKLEKAEAQLAVVIERYTVSDESVQQALQAAKNSLVRAREVVKTQPAAPKKSSGKTVSEKGLRRKVVTPKPGGQRAIANNGAGKNGGRRGAGKAQSHAANEAVAAG